MVVVVPSDLAPVTYVLLEQEKFTPLLVVVYIASTWTGVITGALGQDLCWLDDQSLHLCRCIMSVADELALDSVRVYIALLDSVRATTARADPEARHARLRDYTFRGPSAQETQRLFMTSADDHSWTRQR